MPFRWLTDSPSPVEADIILLDWDLPNISGIELLVELRHAV